jgi:hypothetical protein
MTLYGAARLVYRAAQLQGATRNPGRYVCNRAKSKLLGKVGFWKAFGKFWRA